MKFIIASHHRCDRVALAWAAMFCLAFLAAAMGISGCSDSSAGGSQDADFSEDSYHSEDSDDLGDSDAPGDQDDGVVAGCGDHVCDLTETCDSCPEDCGACAPTCGDMQCDLGETNISCPTDCPLGDAYYVAKDGADTNPGTLEQPWLTLDKAAATLVAGDTVFIRAGTYNERLLPGRSGTADGYITYAAYPGETAIVDGTGFTYSGYGGVLEIYDTSYVKVIGLEITNSASFCVFVTYGSHHVLLHSNTIHNCQVSGIRATASMWQSGAPAVHDLLIDGNEVADTNFVHDQEALSLSGVDSFEIMNNHVHHSEMIGIDTKGACTNGKIHGNIVHDHSMVAIYVDGYDADASNIDIYQNIAYNSSDGISVGTEAGGTLTDIRVMNNLMYGNGNGYSTMFNTTSGSNHKKNIWIINNTITDNHNCCCIQITERREVFENLVIRNNILSNCNTLVNFSYLQDSDVVFDHNLFGSSTGHQGTEFIVGEPQFVNEGADNYKLQPTSPAVDAGSSVDAPTDDLEGVSRPQGAGFDIGCYEQ